MSKRFISKDRKPLQGRAYLSESVKMKQHRRSLRESDDMDDDDEEIEGESDDDDDLKESSRYSRSRRLRESDEEDEDEEELKESLSVFGLRQMPKSSREVAGLMKKVSVTSSPTRLRESVKAYKVIHKKFNKMFESANSRPLSSFRRRLR